MRKYFIFALIFALAIIFYGCDKDPGEAGITEMPEDFAFRITWNTYGISSYDSVSGRLVKTTDATKPEDYVTTLTLTESQLSEIWGIVEALDVESYPEKYDPFENVKSEPSQTVILTTVIDGDLNEIRCEDIAFGSEGATEKGKAFLSAVGEIVSMLESTEEWRSLPEYERFYE